MPTFYEFFCGGGMARAGLGPEWTCLFANDIDLTKARAYAANETADRLIVGDVASLTTANLPGDAADLAWASPPCQDLSLAGDRAGLDGTRSSAFWPFWKLMQTLRSEGRAPRLIVIENVCGLLTSHSGKDFDGVCDALGACGYRFGVVVIDAALFVPQSRERVFIVSVDADAYIPAKLVADGSTTPFDPPTLVAACNRQRNPIWWRLPILPKRNSTFADIIEDEPSGVRWHTEAETERLLGMMTLTNIAKVEAAKRVGERMVGGLYRAYPSRHERQKDPARGSPLRRHRRVPPGSYRRLEQADRYDRRRQSGPVETSVAARGGAADGYVRQLPIAQQP
jgi:DNA (cytosine-5)-methyltransferase 1